GRRVADAGIDVAEGREAEQRSGVIDAFENVRSRLVDRGCARASCGIGLRAGMDRKRGKTRDAFGHAPFLWSVHGGIRRGGRFPVEGTERTAAGVLIWRIFFRLSRRFATILLPF